MTIQFKLNDTLITAGRIAKLPMGAVIKSVSSRVTATRMDNDHKSWKIAGSDLWYTPEQIAPMAYAWLIIWLPPNPPFDEISFEALAFIKEGDLTFYGLSHLEGGSLGDLQDTRLSVTIKPKDYA